MTWGDLRRLLRHIARAADCWRLAAATRGLGADRWRAIVDDGDTGRWQPSTPTPTSPRLGFTIGRDRVRSVSVRLADYSG